MLVNITAAKCIGINAVKVTVEVDISNGIGIHLCGLADVAVKESLLRTMTALEAVGFKIPGRKIVINLAPADLHKNGSGYDLPIAVGIIAASAQMSLPLAGDYVIMGELGLDASIRTIPGGLPFAELAEKEGFRGIILPEKSAAEAREFSRCEVFGVRTLNDVLRILNGEEDASDLLVRQNSANSANASSLRDNSIDFNEIIGQEGAKRGVEIAAAGSHNLIMVGSPGSGKSSLAKALAGILPPMTREEALVTSKIYSIAGRGDLSLGLMKQRPFRAPHYSASLPAIIGGGAGDTVMPGEISLAENGVLFLDEFGQMPKSVVEALRGPMEDRKVVISRLKSKVEYPASFMLVAASNPCPCGYYGEGDRCTCTPTQRLNYLARLSGPLMDRIDLHLWMHSIDPSCMTRKRECESSATVAARVMRARQIQNERFRGEEINTNAEMTNKLIEKYCPLSQECTELLGRLMERTGMSMRAYFRIIKVARTIADLEGNEKIEPRHISEAAGFRFLDRLRQL